VSKVRSTVMERACRDREEARAADAEY